MDLLWSYCQSNNKSVKQMKVEEFRAELWGSHFLLLQGKELIKKSKPQKKQWNNDKGIYKGLATRVEGEV